jgi:hypothetical protein
VASTKGRTISSAERILLVTTLVISSVAILIVAYTLFRPQIGTFVTFNQEEDDFEFSNELNNDVSTEDTSVPPPDEDHLPANLPDESGEDGEIPAPDDDTAPFIDTSGYQGECIVGDYRPGGQSIRMEADLPTCFGELGGFAWCRDAGVVNPFSNENKINQGNQPARCFNTVDKDGSTSTCEGCSDGGILGMCYDIKGAFPGQDAAVTEANDCASKGGTFCQPGDNSPECLWDYSTKEGGYQCRRPGTCGEEDSQGTDDEEAAENSGRVSEFVFNCVQDSIGSDGIPSKTADDCLAECASDPECSEQLDAASDSGVYDPGELPNLPPDPFDANTDTETALELLDVEEDIKQNIRDCVDNGGNFRDCFAEFGPDTQGVDADSGDTVFIENPDEFFDLGLDEDGLVAVESELLRGLSESLDQLRKGLPPQTSFDQALRDAFYDNVCTSIPSLCQSGGVFREFDRWLNNFCATNTTFCQDPSLPGTSAPGETDPTQEAQKGKPRIGEAFCAALDVDPGTAPIGSVPRDTITTSAQFNNCFARGNKVCVTWLYEDNSTETLCGNVNDLTELQEVLDEEQYIDFFTEADRARSYIPPPPGPSISLNCGQFINGRLVGLVGGSVIADALGMQECRESGGTPFYKRSGEDPVLNTGNDQDFLNKYANAARETEMAAERFEAFQEAEAEDYENSSAPWDDYVGGYAEASYLADLLGPDATPEEIAAFIELLNREASQRADAWNRMREEAGDTVDPQTYVGAFGSEWGYAGDDPRYQWDSWRLPGTCIDESSLRPIGGDIFNSWDASKCLGYGGTYMIGPDRNIYRTNDQLQNTLDNVLRNRYPNSSQRPV